MPRLLLDRLIRSDPASFIGSFGLWGIVWGVAMIVSDNIFDVNPLYGYIKKIYDNELVWGSMLAADGVLLILSLRMRPVPIRASIAAFSAILWMFFGSLIFIGAYQNGYYSAAAIYCMLGAIGCIMACELYIKYPGTP